jgi:hypothetical protein
MDEHVHVAELTETLGYRRPGSISHLVREGEIAAPQQVLGADRRWKRAWPRAYIDELLRNPPPRLAARLGRQQPGITRRELATALGLEASGRQFKSAECLMDRAGVERLARAVGRRPEDVRAWLLSGPPDCCQPTTRAWLEPAMRSALHRLFGGSAPGNSAPSVAEVATG